MDSALLKNAPLFDGAAEAGSAVMGGQGIYDGTLIATVNGWRRVENLRAGDQVLTLDSGPVPLLSMQENMAIARPGQPQDWPRLVPDGVLGNRGPLTLSAHQAIMLESDMAPAFAGDRFALIPISALDGYRGISVVPPEQGQRAWLLELEEEQILLAAGDALLHCPAQTPSDEPRYPILTEVAAAALVTLMGCATR